MRIELLILISVTSVFLGCSHTDKNSPNLVEFHCTPAKEFITTVSYLRQARAFKLSEEEMRSTALSVAKGCVDAAKRFINTVDLLVTARLPGKAAVRLGIEMASRTNEQSDAFEKVFKSAFSKAGLDLNLPESVDVAEQIAAMTKEKSVYAADDFDQLVHYCVSKEQLNLPRTYCYRLAMKLSLSNEDRERGIAEAFIDHIEFMVKDDEGPKLTTKAALEIASELIAISPFAPSNFEEAYRFAVTKPGLGMTRSDGVAFAKKLAAHTRQLKSDASSESGSKLTLIAEP